MPPQVTLGGHQALGLHKHGRQLLTIRANPAMLIQLSSESYAISFVHGRDARIPWDLASELPVSIAICFIPGAEQMGLQGVTGSIRESVCSLCNVLEVRKQDGKYRSDSTVVRGGRGNFVRDVILNE